MNVALALPRRSLLPVVLVATAVPLLAVGEPGPAGAVPGASAEFRVNTTTESAQDAPKVAVDADGDSVVVWASNQQDGSGYGVYAQRYDAAGVPQGGETRVNEFIGGDQREPSVAMDARGNYVVTWASLNQDGSGWGIYARHYDSDGSAASPEMRVHSTTSGDQRQPTVAMEADGAYVIAWIGPDEDGTGVFAQRFDAYDLQVGHETGVNTRTTTDQREPSVAMDADGDYVIAWTSGHQDGGGNSVYAQRYDATGDARSFETRVNSTTTDERFDPSVAMDADGDTIITWTSANQDGSTWGVYAKRYNAFGDPLGAETRVNTTTASWQHSPSVAMDADGDAIITWSSTGQDGSGEGVYTQRYDATGDPQGAETRVNTTNADHQTQSHVAVDADGDHTIAWQSYHNRDSSGTDIYGRRFRGPEQVDLTVDQTVDPEPVPVGGRMEYRLRVSNVNEPSTATGVPALDTAIDAATGVRLRVIPPDGATLTRFEGTDWVCVMRFEALLCRYTEPIPADEVARTLVLTYTAGMTAGPVQHLARVSDRHVDPVTADNHAADRTMVRCTVQLDGGSYTAAETGNLSATVTRRGLNCGASSVRYETLSGSASPGVDFADVAGTLVWGDHTGPQVVSVPVLDDALDESNEHLRLVLSNPVGVLLGHRTLATGVIVDNDDPPRINFVTATGSTAEPGELVEITARLSEVSGRPVTVTLAKAGTATSGSDYHAPARLTIPAGERTATFSLEVVDDTLAEGTETAVIALTSPAGAALGTQKTYRLTIADDE